MTTTKHKAYNAAAANLLAAGLDSLANNTNSASSAAINNDTALDLFMDLELVLAAQGAARSSSAVVQVFMVQALDGTNYGTEDATSSRLIASFPLPATTAAQRVTMPGVRIPPSKFKVFLRNATGQAFAASNNQLRYRTYSVETV